MGATQVIKSKTTVTRTRVKVSKNKTGTAKKGNPNRCPTCGRYR